jgi:hypothetical protein
MHRIFKETRIGNDPDGAELYVMLPATTQAEITYDGIDSGGERVAVEVSVGGIVCQIAQLSAPHRFLIKLRNWRRAKGNSLLCDWVQLGRFTCTLCHWVRIVISWHVSSSCDLSVTSMQRPSPTEVLCHHRLEYDSNPTPWTSPLSYVDLKARFVDWAETSQQNRRTILCHR